MFTQRRRWWVHTFVQQKTQIESVFVPISGSMVLVGQSSNEMPDINFRKFRKEYSKWCREFFICPEDSREVSFLSKTIGQSIEPFIQAKSTQMIKSISKQLK